MVKNGFTLVELLAVLIILVVILAIAVPGIVGIIDSVTQNAFESDAKMVLTQLEYQTLEDEDFDITSVTEESIKDLRISNANYYDLRVGLVDSKPYIVIVGINKWNGFKVCGTIKNMQIVSANDAGTCEDIQDKSPSEYIASEGVNKPKLATGMTPVIWDGDSWEAVAENSPDWYNYTSTDKKWANARTTDGSLWVWIPRYAYQIADCYHLNAAQCNTATGRNSGTINIKFLKDTTNTTSDSTTIDLTPTYSGNSQTNYIKHPAFTFGTTEVTGIWVAKFEMSGTTASLDSKSGANSLISLTLGSMFTSSRNMETNNKYGWGLANGLNANGTFTTDTNNVDVHMMKNIEWGAAAYLAQSTYGKDAEIWMNPSNSRITGCSGTDIITTASSGCSYTYETNNGKQASTTGNIYGIYDMAGGTFEYVMGNLNDIAAGSGLTPSGIDNKYIDRYTGYNNTKYGDAVYETSASSGGENSWNGDSSYFIGTSYSWFKRGGDYPGAANNGIYDYYYDDGYPFVRTFRTVVIAGNGF